MSVQVALDIFSGRPNPTVTLEGREAASLLERAQPTVRIELDESPTPPPTLGYRGILIDQDETADLPRLSRIRDNRLFGAGLAHHARDESLEEFLISDEGPFAQTETGIEVLSDLSELRDKALTTDWSDWSWLDDIIIPPWPAPCKCGPIYEPSWWNVPSRQPYNNCYNYATNYRTDTFAQPGRANGAMYSSLTCRSVQPAAVADKLIESPDADNRCPEEGHLVALVVWPGGDYHWYRKGEDGWWTHKPGSTAVTNLDNSGKKIVDPRTADRGPYTEFCTFMVVMHGHIKIG